MVVAGNERNFDSPQDQAHLENRIFSALPI
jgi:hypothetical protein